MSVLFLIDIRQKLEENYAQNQDARSKYTKLCGALCGKFTKKLNKITQSWKDQHKSKIFYHTQTLFDVNATLAIVSTTNKLITKWNE